MSVLLPVNQLPVGAATALTGDSGNQAATNAVATLTAPAAKTAWIAGFACTASGATGALAVTVTVAGLAGGTLHFTFVYPAGVTLQATPLLVTFTPPLPASAQNTNIVVTLPSSGAGGTNATCTAWGFLE